MSRIERIERGDGNSIVALAQEGDRDALGELFVRHHAEVRRLLRSILGPGIDLDDLVQDVFIQVHRSIRGFRHGAKFSTWLHRLTARQAYSFLRQRKRRAVPIEPRELDQRSDLENDDAHQRIVVRETIRRFYKLMDTVGFRRRIAFTLFAIEGRSIAEAAEILGLSSPAAKSRIWFARREIFKKARRDPYLAPLVDDMDEP